ncbi:MAG: hypothetical protein KJZ69_08720 [Phycisphaerales bacterium]|nr:hypothetical protein [Phycisphaerales bacterium]
MSPNLFRTAASAGHLVLLLFTQAASAQPSIVSRTLVSMGDYNYPVNETTVAAYGGKLVAMWNIMEWNSQGQQWRHYRLGYAVSEDGGESWTDMGFFPRPDGCSLHQLDPTVVADPLGSNAGDFIGAGVVECSGFSAIRAHVARLPDGETTFDDSIALSNGSLSCGTDYTQIAAGPDPSDPQGSTHIYMTGFTTQGGLDCSPLTLCLFRSSDAGETWSNRSIVYIVDESAAQPVAAPWPAVAANGSLYIAYNDETNTSARKINILTNVSAGSGEFTNLALDHARIAFSFPNATKMYGNYIAGDFRVLHGI